MMDYSAHSDINTNLAIDELSTKELADRVVRWLESIKESRGYRAESRFEEDHGLPVNTFQHLRNGKLPKLDKIVKIIVGTKTEWKEFGEAIFSDSMSSQKKKSTQRRGRITAPNSNAVRKN